MVHYLWSSQKASKDWTGRGLTGTGQLRDFLDWFMNGSGSK